MRIDFYFDFISPFSYLAAERIPDLQQSTGVEVSCIPINLPRLFKLSGNTPPAMVPNKARYLVKDLRRQAKKMQIPFRLILPGSFDRRPALGIACVLSDADRARYSSVVFKSLWSGDVDPRQDGWLQQIFASGRLPAAWNMALNEDMLTTLQANTLQAFEAGAFGAPTFVLHYKKRSEMYVGIDHMNDLRARCLELKGR